MRVVIIPGDKTIGKNGLFYSNLDFSSCSIPSNVRVLQWNERGDEKGWLELNDGTPNVDIENLPEWANLCLEQWNLSDNLVNNPLPLTPEQIKSNNKIKATQLLYETDWTELNSVNDVNSVPHLLNYEDYNAYRQSLRQIVTNPPDTEITWPTKPQSVWSN